MGRYGLKASFALAVLLCATSAAAAPVDAIKSRITSLRELGAAMKAVNDGLKSDEPQTILIQQSARQIRNAANQMPGWFPAGTGPEAGVKTAAKPDIWSQAPKFKAALAAFAGEAARFQAVAATGDAAAMKVAARNLGMTCKSCHDSFRVPGN
ncbi:MAG: cytochrome c [Sphingomonadales bacterium]|nr:cytochrome c [Sphingomonadales bacterium]